MRTAVHFIALLLAVTLVFKPCASAIAAYVDERPVQTSALAASAGIDDETSCISKCLKARVEVTRKFQPKPLADTTSAPAWPDAGMLARTMAEWERINRTAFTISPVSLRHVKCARDALYLLCRQLT